MNKPVSINKRLRQFIFRKAGFGASISREETIERLNPLIKHHMELNLAYNNAIDRISRADVAQRLSGFQRVARADVGKLAETVFSAGGPAYNGTDLEAENYGVGETDDEILFNLLDREQAFQDALVAEDEILHHIRTDAVLNIVRTNSKARLNYLTDITRRRRRPRPARTS